MSVLLKTDELSEWFGCKQSAKLVRLLREKNIPFHLNAIGHPITTLDAINGSLNGKQIENDKVDF